MAFRLPLANATVLSPFGPRRPHFHEGIDIRRSRRGGEPVTASASGRVVETRSRHGYGRQILIQHKNGWYTRYGHLRSVKVREGQWVEAGVTIGTVGSSGNARTPHLHFEILTPDRRPVDPAPYIFHN